jgi:hypothetical protein
MAGRVGAADGLGTGLGQREVLHLALLNQFLDGAGDVLDDNVGVDAVLIQQVDGVHLQPPQHRVDHLTNVLGPAVEAVAATVGIDPKAELGGDHDLIPEGSQGFADEFFVREGAVGLGGVEHRHTALDGRPDDVNPLLPPCRGP